MLEVRNIEKDYEGCPLLRGVSLVVSRGETVCLLGASGSGKSTLLRIIAGLEKASRGKVLWDGQDLQNVAVHRRNFGLMFQDYALFPHRSVAQNVAFGLRMQGLPDGEIRARVHEALEQVNMEAFANRRVTDLSGGEQQRVALARALAPRPRLLMLDEPLGALDRALKEDLAGELRSLLHKTQIPAIYVTHDQGEAFSLGDRLILLHQGRVEQAGSPEEVYSMPVSAWAAGFLGLSNLLAGQIISLEPLRAQTGAGVFTGVQAAPMAGASQGTLQVGMQVTLLFRPSSARLEGGGDNLIKGKVEDCFFAGQSFRMVLRLESGQQFSFFLNRRVDLGERIMLRVPEENIQFLMDPPTGEY